MVRSVGRAVVSLCVLTFSLLESTQTEPWLGNAFEFECRPSFVYQGYRSLASGAHDQKYVSDDLFLNMSMSNALPSIGIEFELLGARTRGQKSDLDQLKLTGRYVWQDDIAGDAYSLVTGLSYVQAFQHSLKDMSSFHHGLCEGEAFLSVGKEFAQECAWKSRYWGLFGIGAATGRGSPWVRCDIAYETCFGEVHALRLALDSLWGMGKHSLRMQHFDGYGPIQHQSVDVGVRYTYLLAHFGNVNLEYSYRLHAKNFPEHVHRIIAQILYTFGL